MDTDDANTLRRFCLNGYTTYTLFPFMDEVVNVGRVVVEILSKLVMKGAEIGCLVSVSSKVKDDKQPFYQFCEWQHEQILIKRFR